ncbi:hypothetical protein KACC15558_34160 [Brevibacterium ammoniilyticum]|uniref:Uncharacterized protein n=1 Tax=Brevibacterium ammoniilyticum TaxID=1046555 RepID=A0ABP9U465_9MICO
MGFHTAVGIADQDAGDWRDASPLTPREAADHVRNPISIEQIVDDGDDHTDSYRLILSTSMVSD